jgi:hypothetical protein
MVIRPPSQLINLPSLVSNELRVRSRAMQRVKVGVLASSPV